MRCKFDVSLIHVFQLQGLLVSARGTELLGGDIQLLGNRDAWNGGNTILRLNLLALGILVPLALSGIDISWLPSIIIIALITLVVKDEANFGFHFYVIY